MHEIPRDLAKILHTELLEKWNKLTFLGQNEWICWLTIVKKPETRTKHLIRLEADILKGKKRPCCWPGCPHRILNAAKYFSKNLNL